MQEDNISMAVRPEMSVMSLDEITTYIKARLAMMAEDAIYIGHALIAAKAKCRHGEFAGWLESNFGFKQSTANSCMRLAREVTPDSPLAHLPYTKALALLAAPEDEREKLADGAESASVRELRERVKQAEAERDAARKNAETAAAKLARTQNIAEAYSENHFTMMNEKNVLEERLKTIMDAPPENVEVEAEVAPPDYEAIKAHNVELADELRQAEQYAEQAEEDANAAREELRRIQQEQISTGNTTAINADGFKKAVGHFMAEASIYANMGVIYANASTVDLSVYNTLLTYLEEFTASMRSALNVRPVVVLDKDLSVSGGN